MLAVAHCFFPAGKDRAEENKIKMSEKIRKIFRDNWRGRHFYMLKLERLLEILVQRFSLVNIFN